MPASKLIKPNIDFKESYLKALEEYQKEGRFKFYNLSILAGEFDAFIEDRNNPKSHDFQDFPDWVEPVPETILWLIKDEEYLGTIEIRHRLNWHLEKWGGNINFIIRPEKRNMGYGKKILRKAIPFADNLGIDRALMTVDPTNSIARHIVEKVGAEFEDETTGTDRFPARCRYWLNCRI